MSVFTMKMPDVGEGIAEAELVEWSVVIGEFVKEDQVLAAVMTDKATVEIPSPVAGIVVWLGGKIGQQLAIGGDLIRIEVDSVAAKQPPVGEAATADTPILSQTVDIVVPEPVIASSGSTVATTKPGMSGPKPLASPSVRLHARSHGVDLRYVSGSGPAGRILHTDLENYLAGKMLAPIVSTDLEETVRETKIVGLRRKIAERMANAKRRIPHITIIEEIDMSAVETLREQLTAEQREGGTKLTVLPFLMAAVCRAVREQPAMNAHFDDENEILREFSSIHIGIATQTKGGLMVPVVRNCERRSLWDAAGELARVATAARSGGATREELSGSTITISSLGPLGAIATTPIINQPEVAIIGVNRMEIRPRWDGAAFVPRKMMNLSSSFDHRVIDGWDAALFVKRIKTLLETPALIFMER